MSISRTRVEQLLRRVAELDATINPTIRATLTIWGNELREDAERAYFAEHPRHRGAKIEFLISALPWMTRDEARIRGWA